MNEDEVREKLYSVYKAYLKGADISSEDIDKFFEIDKYDIDSLIDEVVSGRLSQEEGIKRTEILASNVIQRIEAKKTKRLKEFRVKKKAKRRKTKAIRLVYDIRRVAPYNLTILKFFPDDIVLDICEKFGIDPLEVSDNEMKFILEKLREMNIKPKPDTPQMYIEALRKYHGFNI